ncbi:MAG: hypothetical protein R3E86_12880 [Pseudomonadales bacterium]
MRALWVALCLGCAAAHGYEADIHQQLTFLAAKQLNRCVEGSNVEPLTPLQVRYIARSNVALADSNLFVRMFRWSYYDPTGRERNLLWLISTRFSAHFADLVAGLERAEPEPDGYRELGRIISYVQLVSAPAHAVPVYTGRFWRWNIGDRFDDYPLDAAAVEAALGEDCGFLQPLAESYEAELAASAAGTLVAVSKPIGGLPATWEAFWRLPAEPGTFGEYGPAGNNFGRRAEFPCVRSATAGSTEQPKRKRCVLLEDDPLYDEFARNRHVSAVRHTARVMLLYQVNHTHQPEQPDGQGDSDRAE